MPGLIEIIIKSMNLKTDIHMYLFFFYSCLYTIEPRLASTNNALYYL